MEGRRRRCQNRHLAELSSAKRKGNNRGVIPTAPRLLSMCHPERSPPGGRSRWTSIATTSLRVILADPALAGEQRDLFSRGCHPDRSEDGVPAKRRCCACWGVGAEWRDLLSLHRDEDPLLTSNPLTRQNIVKMGRCRTPPHLSSISTPSGRFRQPIDFMQVSCAVPFSCGLQSRVGRNL
jgi:hypothetical protein